MCGIAGLVTLGDQLGPEIGPKLRTMGQTIAHRGPDDEQIYLDGPLGLVFRRLSIVDLAGGRQPLENEEGSVVVVANGEIYNHLELRRELEPRHRFRSRSDCEVLVHLYEERGLGFLDALVGMYAIALWDRRRELLILAVDRFGIKPLFIAPSAERVLFASEMKALWAFPDGPRELDWQGALTDSLFLSTLGHGAPPTLFKGTELLPPGSALIVKPRERAIERICYWRPPKPSAEEQRADQRSEEDLIDAYAGLLDESVRSCLMADVELGVFLSGGIDSVAIASLAARHAHFHTFSVLGQSTLGNGDAKHSHLAAQALGLPSHQVLFDWRNHSFTADDWRRLLYLTETPLCGAEQLYKFQLHRFAKELRPGLKVILLGQGSDEFNGGYTSLSAPPGAQNWEGFVAHLRDIQRGSDFRPWEAELGPIFARDFTAPSAQDEESPYHFYLESKRRHLAGYNLWHEDRTAAGNSIENRVPFLDHRLVELAFSVPERMQAGLFWDKQILRRGMIGIVGRELAFRPKVPFFYGVDVRYTNRMMLALLEQDDCELLEQAFGQGTPGAAVIDLDAILTSVRRVAEDPEHGGLELLLRMVNMGLLAQMAQAGRPVLPALSAPIPIELPIGDWDAEENLLRIRLGAAQPNVGLDAVLDFTPGVYLVRPDGIKASPNELYLVVNEKVEYELQDATGDWIKVLRAINGERPLREILSTENVAEADIRKDLEEALELGVLVRAAHEGQIE